MIGYNLWYWSSIQEKNFKEINTLYDLLEAKKYDDFFKWLKKYNISYILLRNDFDFEKNSKNMVNYGDNFSYFENWELADVLNKRLQNKNTFGELTLYKTNIGDNLIYSDNNLVTYKTIDPTKYTILVKNVKNNFELNFLEAFDDNWILKINNKTIR